MTKMLRTINGWRFELPLAALLALALGFAVLVMPAPMIGTLPGADRLGPATQPLIALVAALLGGLVALGLMFGAGRKASAPRRAAAAAARAEAEEGEHPFGKAFEELMEPPVAAPVAEPTVRVRRADAHPDAPPRAPILATRDLGEPFMGFAPEPEPAPQTPAIPDGDYVELPQAARDGFAASASDSALPVESGDDAGIWIDAEPADEQPAPVFTPEPASPPIARATAPVRPERQSITDMMARLDAGMLRRSGRALPPRDARPALRDALAELNRLAARRG